jgi:lactate permease
MNFSGQTLTLGMWLAGAGSFFAFLAPVVGWFGVMISPQSLAVAAAAVAIVGAEGALFRRVFLWSVALLALLCTIVYLQSTGLLSWMVPG